MNEYRPHPDLPRILVVDDSTDDQFVYQRLLTQEPSIGSVMYQAMTGADGLAALRRAHPDCILLDYRLPDMTGLEFVETMRMESGELSIPVLMLTGEGSEQVAVAAMKAGVADYVDKTQVSREALQRMITNALEKHRLRVAVGEHQMRLAWMVKDLERKNSEIQTFYHTLSHELKSPLTAAIEFIALVLDDLAGPINEQQRDFLNTAKENCARINVYINDILDMSRLETGKLTLRRSPADVSRVVAKVVESLAGQAKARGVDLRSKPAKRELMTEIDEDRIAQVLTNLIGNAIKFTPPGGKVQVRTESRPGDPERFTVSVSDTGRGIAEAKLRSIFQRHVQAKEEDFASKGGLGLGLAICAELVDLHGGRIWVESEEGKGSTFTFSLPVGVMEPVGVR